MVVVLYLLVAFSHIFPRPPFPSEFYFSAQKNLTSIPKKMKIQKLKFKKNFKKKQKKYSTILSALLTFSIVSCDLCLVLCSIDDEHLIMNVLVYSDKEKKPKKRSEFNSVYNKKILKMTLIARKTGWGISPLLSVTMHIIPALVFNTELPTFTISPIFLLFSCICELVQEC